MVVRSIYRMTSRASSDGMKLGESASTTSRSSRQSLAKAAARKAALKAKQERMEEQLAIEQRKVQLETDYMKEKIALQQETMEAEAAELERQAQAEEHRAECKAQEDKRLAAEKRRRAARQAEIEKRRLSHELAMKNVDMIEAQHKLETEVAEAEAEESVLRIFAEHEEQGLGLPMQELEESMKPAASGRAPSESYMKLMSLPPLTDSEKGVMQAGVAVTSNVDTATSEAPADDEVQTYGAGDSAGYAHLVDGVQPAGIEGHSMEPEYQQQHDDDYEDEVADHPGYEEALVTGAHDDVNVDEDHLFGYEDHQARGFGAGTDETGDMAYVTVRRKTQPASDVAEVPKRCCATCGSQGSGRFCTQCGAQLCPTYDEQLPGPVYSGEGLTQPRDDEESRTQGHPTAVEPVVEAVWPSQTSMMGSSTAVRTEAPVQLGTADLLKLQGSKSSESARPAVASSQAMSTRVMTSQQHAPMMSVAATASTSVQTRTKAATAAPTQWMASGAGMQQQAQSAMLSVGAQAFTPQDRSQGTAASAMQGTTWVPAMSTAPIMSVGQPRSVGRGSLQGSWVPPAVVAPGGQPMSSTPFKAGSSRPLIPQAPATQQWRQPAPALVQLPDGSIGPVPAAAQASPHVSFDMQPAYYTYPPSPQQALVDNRFLSVMESIAAMTQNLALPKSELMKFDGDPKNYYSFITTFENNIGKRVVDPATKLTLLIQYCTGKAKRAISDAVVRKDASEGYAWALEVLKEQFGKPYEIARAMIDGLNCRTPLKNDVQSLVDLANDMARCELTLTQLGHMSDINSTDTLKGIVGRLPYYMRVKWADYIHEKMSKGEEPSFSHLTEFVKKRAQVASSTFGKDVMMQEKSARTKPDSKKVKEPAPKVTTMTTDVASAPPPVKKEQSKSTSNGNKPPQKTAPPKEDKKCGVCDAVHHVSKCKKFKSMSVPDRRKIVFEKRMCFNCLDTTHAARDCKKEPQCPTCRSKHHELVHLEGYVPKDRNAPEPEEKNASVNTATVEDADGASPKICMRIVPVKVQGANGKEVETYALLDCGSNKSLCSESLLSDLGVTGTPISYSLKSVDKLGRRHGYSASLWVKPIGSSAAIEIPNVWSSKSLHISMNGMPDENDVRAWPHLNDVSLTRIDAAEVTLLIGSDVPEAFWVEDERRGSIGEPYAIKTPLGWALLGPIGKGKQQAEVCYTQAYDDMLQEKLEMMWKADFGDAMNSPKAEMSQEDIAALKIMKSTLVNEGNRYRLSLPWRKDPATLPNNLALAQSRLNYLQRRLTKDDDLHQAYTKSVQDYIDKGFARPVTSDELRRDRAWYIPHHAVINPNKPGKTRVVFDCAAKYRGVSLNDNLLNGPDLVNSLVGVLIRFRQERVAMIADVEAMFHQVLVREEDSNYLRFLWWENGDMSQPPVPYCMTRHIFGATSSPSCASFALKKCAWDNTEAYSEAAVNTVLKNFYVDDCLKSVADVPTAVALIPEVCAVLSCGGFRLTKWLSNERAVVTSVPEEERAPSLKSYDLSQKLPYERALGLQWDTEHDSFTFKIEPKEKPETRRGILSVTSSLYDPLGLVAPVTIVPKMIQQDLCRLKLKWDDEVPAEAAERWKSWLSELPALMEVHVSRCYKPPGLLAEHTVELHHFCDASETAYGAVSYVKMYDDHGNVQVTLVVGKARVAPIQPVTIPRLELSAAVVAVRLHEQVIAELEYDIKQVYFWTDSMSTVKYIRNKTSRFKRFVANRLSVIHEASSPEEWMYVPTKQNPADLASRGVRPNDARALAYWLGGPKFLLSGVTDYPQQPASLSTDDPEQEVRNVLHVFASEIETDDDLVDNYDVIGSLLERCSSWHAIQKRIAWLVRFREYCIRRYLYSGDVRTGLLTVPEMEAAQLEVVRQVQAVEYYEELAALRKNAQLPKSSQLIKLCPILEDGVIRVGGRLEKADLTYDVKHPIVIPGKSRLAELMIREVHECNGHVGAKHILSLLNQRYWLTPGISSIRSVLSDCFMCKKRNAQPCSQKMAALPPERVIADLPPFTNVGVDYFGPMNVVQGRSTVKRYGCLFTCMASRAVHIEVAGSLDTQSFLAALSRFISRRGKPAKIFSDNGTNFTSADKELRSLVEAWNQAAIHESLLQRQIEWHFIPPAASHMGGVWERLVKSVKTVLRVLLDDKLVKDEVLTTLMCEVERILNDRPITPSSGDSRDAEPLTPSKILLLKGNSCVVPGSFDMKDNYGNRRWRQAQLFADQFWKRWLSEYVPLLQERQKWTTPARNVTVGDIVLVCDEVTPRGQWPMGVVEEVQQSSDDLVRSCVVRCRGGHKIRPITKLCLLEEAR